MTTALAATTKIGHDGLDINAFARYVVPGVVLQPHLAKAGLTEDDLLYKNRPNLSPPHCKQLTDLLWPEFTASMRNGNDVESEEARAQVRFPGVLIAGE